MRPGFQDVPENLLMLGNWIFRITPQLKAQCIPRVNIKYRSSRRVRLTWEKTTFSRDGWSNKRNVANIWCVASEHGTARPCESNICIHRPSRIYRHSTGRHFWRTRRQSKQEQDTPQSANSSWRNARSASSSEGVGNGSSASDIVMSSNKHGSWECCETGDQFIQRSNGSVDSIRDTVGTTSHWEIDVIWRREVYVTVAPAASIL